MTERLSLSMILSLMAAQGPVIQGWICRCPQMPWMFWVSLTFPRLVVRVHHTGPSPWSSLQFPPHLSAFPLVLVSDGQTGSGGGGPRAGLAQLRLVVCGKQEHIVGSSCSSMLLERMALPDPCGPLCFPPPCDPPVTIPGRPQALPKGPPPALSSTAASESEIQEVPSAGPATLQSLTSCWRCFGNQGLILRINISWPPFPSVGIL